MMARFEGFIDESDLSQVSTAALSEELKLRHLADLSDTEPVIEQVVGSDSVTALLQIVLEKALII